MQRDYRLQTVFWQASTSYHDLFHEKTTTDARKSVCRLRGIQTSFCIKNEQEVALFHYKSIIIKHVAAGKQKRKSSYGR